MMGKDARDMARHEAEAFSDESGRLSGHVIDALDTAEELAWDIQLLLRLLAAGDYHNDGARRGVQDRLATFHGPGAKRVTRGEVVVALRHEQRIHPKEHNVRKGRTCNCELCNVLTRIDAEGS